MENNLNTHANERQDMIPRLLDAANSAAEYESCRIENQLLQPEVKP
jgi:hypothetical protein